jgi:tellurite resistance protein
VLVITNLTTRFQLALEKNRSLSIKIKIAHILTGAITQYTCKQQGRAQSMTQILSNITHILNEQIEQHRSKPFLKAAMAACAIIATANGKVTLYQRMKVDQIMETNERLAMFDPHNGTNLFNEYCESLQQNTAATRTHLCETIKAVIDNEETADVLIRLSRTMLQNSDLNDRKAQLEINTLCDLLGAHHQDKRYTG